MDSRMELQFVQCLPALGQSLGLNVSGTVKRDGGVYWSPERKRSGL